MRGKAGNYVQHITFCRICEAFCGLVATVHDGKVVSLHPDKDNPHSRGHVCVKGVNMHAVTHDSDRVTKPLKRLSNSENFVETTWDEALDDIAERLQSIIADQGPGAVAGYLGNPTAFSTNAIMGFGEFLAVIGCAKFYGAASQDTNARMLANFIVHGSAYPFNIPDLERCDFLLVIGANPLVSNGWGICAPRLRHDFDAIAARGRVVVVDPRKTETARPFEHIPIRPDTDVWLLLAMMRIIIDEDLADRTWIETNTAEWQPLLDLLERVDVDAAAARTGIGHAAVAQLARDFATCERGALYAGLGLCRGRYGTLGAFLYNGFNALTGRYGKPGGTRFGRNLVGSVKPFGGGHGAPFTRIGGVPSIAGMLATAMLPADIEEDGEGRVRALIMSAGNPVLSAPGGDAMARALGGLELFVSLDLYVNESNRHAHYVLPTPTFLERADWPYVGMGKLLRPFLQYTDAVIDPVGEVRDDYWIYDQLARRMGFDAPSPSPDKQDAARRGELADPVGQFDAVIRAGPAGDGFGENPDGWSRARLREFPHGVMLDDLPDDLAAWRERIGHPDGKLRLWHPLIEDEFARLFAEAAARDREHAAGALILIGRRDIRSINSWMHNVDKLVRSAQPTLLVHPRDAQARGIENGDRVRISNANAAIELAAEISDDVVPGTVSYPHGWGHAAGWDRANRTAGANVNQLAGTGTQWIEFVSGMSLIDCLTVTLEPSGRDLPVEDAVV